MIIDAPDRFWNKVEISAGCWNWSGALDEHGYGLVWVRPLPNRRIMKAHRISWMLAGHPLAAHKVLHHICENRQCVNPAHLKLMTRGAHVGMHRAAITYCKHGHEYTFANTILTRDGRRNCRTCKAIRQGWTP